MGRWGRIRREKPNKFSAVKQTYNGCSYDSKKEAEYAKKLDWMKKGNLVMKWERQHKIEVRVEGVHICNYYIDFKVYFINGSVEYHEVKGYSTDVWRLKWKLAKACYPNRIFKLIK